MLECGFDSWRGSFHLQIGCRFATAWTVIFGPSGAGKTTLLRLLAGLDRDLSHGSEIERVVFNEAPLTDSQRGLRVPPGRRKTGMVAQQPALFPHLTAAANVAYGLQPLDRASRSKRVEEMLDLVGAAELAHRNSRDLSGGQAQRVALARALAPAPKLLLLDEPFSALDGEASDLLLDRIRSWVDANGVQAILATHDVSDALMTGAEVLLLREGRQVALGPAAEVLAGERQRLLGRLGST
jgi:ABC-type sulfate/molybdate transport systems ATPase subunit